MAAEAGFAEEEGNKGQAVSRKRVVRTHAFRGHRWRVFNNTRLPKGQFGECLDVRLGADFRCIKIPIDGDELHELDTIIHEGLHACTELEEEAVNETARDVAWLLWRLGWRKEDDA